jgi:uncharacterized repeat protein (TIGR03803 family)
MIFRNKPSPRTKCKALGCLGLGLLLSYHLPAQSLTTLYSFSDADGSQPQSPLVYSGGTLYGATRYGGETGHGVVFKLDTNGTAFSKVYTFTDSDVDGNASGPYGRLLVLSNAIYGTASGEPSGTVFKINTDGSAQKVIHIFSGGLADDEPFGGVIVSGNTLYGTTSAGGVFKVNTDGTGFAMLHCFSCETNAFGMGSSLYGGLALADNWLYGTTSDGGSANAGTIFKLNTAGVGLTTLHEFQVTDGRYPLSELLYYSNRLYGTTTSGGGSNTVGVVFAINPDGSGFTVLHRFVGLEGGWPQGGLVCSGNTLYGTTMQGGGVGAAGIVFALKIDGTGFRTLYTFTGGNDGGAPAATLTLAANSLYGTTTSGGVLGKGTIFQLPLPAPTPAGFIRASNSLVVTWPSTQSGLVLQTTTDLKTWTTVSNAPLLLNGQYAVTNTMSDTRRFFRLSQ